LPPAKISVSTATAHGGGFLSLFWWFSLTILQGFYVRLVQNMRIRCGNLVKTRWKKNLSIVVSFVVGQLSSQSVMKSWIVSWVGEGE
jgi:hypothetical protein